MLLVLAISSGILVWLIMQLSKKLETLLMENEDLRDNNDRLNQRLVQVECEKLELMNGGES